MPVMDEFKEEREAIKNASLKEKLKYFWNYYKFHTIVTVSAIVLFTTLIHDVVTQKDDAFFAVMLNGSPISTTHSEEFTQNFANYAEIDTKTYDVLVDDTLNFSASAVDELTMSASQRLLAYTSAGTLDVIVGDSDAFPNQANQGMFYDLREILSEEQLAKYEPYFYYVDQDIITEWDKISEEAGFNAAYPDMPDPTKPENMSNPIPVGIFVTDCTIITDSYNFGDSYIALGIIGNAPHLDASLQFIDYLFE